MVYCSKCGTQNLDTAVNCSNCGAPLWGATPQDRPYSGSHHRHYNREHSARDSGIGLLIAGIVVIILGLSFLYGGFGLFLAYFWPTLLVVLGIWLLIRGLMWSQRRNR